MFSGEVYDFYSVSPEYFGYALVSPKMFVLEDVMIVIYRKQQRKVTMMMLMMMWWMSNFLKMLKIVIRYCKDGRNVIKIIYY
jgi:hypothetical protein